MSLFRVLRFAVALLAVFACASGARAALTHDPALQWKTLKSEHFLVHYHDGEESLAHKAIAIAEQAHARLTARFAWIPRERTEIVLTDRLDMPNGHASPVPSNRITIYANPPDEIDSLEDHGGWLETVITHEYAHILHLDKARGAPKVFRAIFGRMPIFFPNTFPNAWQPAWLIEGLATYVETDLERGIGRGQSNFFRMLMRMEVAEGIKPVSQVNQPIASWPTGYVPYLYGVEYHNFIADKKGEDRIFRLVENYSDNFIPFTINSNSKRVFRKNLKGMWAQFDAYLQEKYRPELAAIEARGLREGERLTADGYFGGPVRALADGRVLYVRDDGRSEPALMLLADGEARHLADVHRGARFDVHPDAGVLVAQPERHRNANYFYDLYRYDLNNGGRTRLTHAGRYHYGAWSPDGRSIVAVNTAAGRSSLHLLDARGNRIETLSELAADQVISDLDFAPDGQSVVAAVWRPGTGWDLERFTLADRQWQQLTRDSAIEAQARFTRDGAAVLFTSDHGGVYNLRRLDLASGQVTTLSNVRGGAFHPAIAGEFLYYSGYTARGFDLYRIGAGEPALPMPPSAPGPSAVVALAPPPVEVSADDYSPWRSLRPRWWLPHIAIDTDRTEIGVITAGADTLSRHYYSIDAAYDLSNENFVGSLDYLYDRWYPLFKLHASRSPEFTRDVEGNVLSVRRNDMMQAEMVLPLLSYRRAFSLHLTALQDRESVVQATNTSTTSASMPSVAESDTRDDIVGAALVYNSARRYPLSISRAGGQQLALVAESSDVIGHSDYAGEVYTFDWRGYAGVGGEHVLGLRLLGGWGSDAPQPFQLGGAGPTQYSALELIGSTLTANALFDQREYALRGYSLGLPQLTGRRMAAASLEYRFPLERVERGFMVPFPGALDQVHGALFVDSGSAWDEGGRPDRYYTGVGVSFTADLVLGYGAGFQVSVMFASGLDDDIGDDATYLRAGASF